MGKTHVMDLTASIVNAYVSNNPVPAAKLAELIAMVHAAVSERSRGAAVVVESPVPAVNPKRSIHADHIVCLEDGMRFKMLSRHVIVHHGLTPDEYRAKWGLASDYPMVAPSYSAARSEIAKASGLGRKPQAKIKAKVGRRKKTT